MLVTVFNHHNGAVHHCPDCNGNASKGHDICIYPLEPHNDKGQQDAHRQGGNGNKCRAEVEQEQHADHRDHNTLLKQFSLEVFYCPLYETSPVIDRHDLNTFRKASGKFLKFCAHCLDGRQCVSSKAHDDNTACHLSFTVKFCKTPPEFRTEMHTGDI